VATLVNPFRLRALRDLNEDPRLTRARMNQDRAAV
jgi:hypothetical protein